jgi:hypothetical protein
MKVAIQAKFDQLDVSSSHQRDSRVQSAGIELPKVHVPANSLSELCHIFKRLIQEYMGLI